MSLVLLDRDGVLNFESYAYIKTPDKWLPIPGALEAVARLTQAGLKTAIASNQYPDKNCHCRKPNPTLLLKAAADFNCDIKIAPFVGDRESNVMAAKAARVIPYFLSDTAKDLENVIVCANLNEAVAHILL